MENLNEIVINALGLVVLIVTLVELIGYGTWDKRYFRFGIPIFRRSIPLNSETFVAPSVSHMEAGLPASFWGPPIQFQEIAPGEFAFRNSISEFRYFGIKYPPIMHGYLASEKAKERLVVKGHLILMYPLLILYVIGIGISFDTALVLLVLFGGMSYLCQAIRFNAVAKMATNFFSANPSQGGNAV